ncbi:MFS transporter [Streptomyces sp. BE20]|uniref:MFS transporter n=1 Tax=Streptomyces sp. BE20 TaxID=3002525 RepID=UPI002E7639AF|nr:MFS transporter [Streptomyces sp. BE20]MEE1822094.1 MFS transporter [Streptomyces sp. BE20]
MTSGLPRRFLDLLTRPRVAGAAWWSVVSRLPVYLMSLAVVLTVREQGGSYAQAGLVAALYTLGMALGSPLIARRLDRRGRATVLTATALAYPAALAVLVWVTRPGGWAQPVVAVVAGVVLPPANACMRSLWARLPLREEERETAYLWEALLTEVLVIGAPLMLAALMLVGSAGLALTTVAVLGGLGTLGLAHTRLPPGTDGAEASAPDGPGGPGGGNDPKDPGGPKDRGGLLGPLREPALLALAAVMAVSAVPVGLLTLAIPAFVARHGAPGGAGVVYACWGIGSALGALWLGRSQSRVPPQVRFPRLLLAYALGTGLTLLAGSQVGLALALAVGSAPIALVSASEMTLVSAIADGRSLAEAFTWASLATVLGDALGQQVGGLLMDPFGPRAVFAVATCTALAAAGLAFACRGLLARRPAPLVECAA